jgi:hypothetical protein
MHDCPCCGMPVHAPVEHAGGRVVLVPLCDGCKDVGPAQCDPEDTWHCDGRNGHQCDGSGCEEYESKARADRAYWDER